jgi:hypothetical protein
MSRYVFCSAWREARVQAEFLQQLTDHSLFVRARHGIPWVTFNGCVVSADSSAQPPAAETAIVPAVRLRLVF